MTIPSTEDNKKDQDKERDEFGGIFSYLPTDDDTDPRIIASCRLTLDNFKRITDEEIFRVDSCWKYRELLYNTTKTYGALTLWFPGL